MMATAAEHWDEKYRVDDDVEHKTIIASIAWVKLCTDAMNTWPLLSRFLYVLVKLCERTS